MAEKTKYLIKRSVNTKIINFLNNSKGTRRSSLSFKVNKIIFLLAINKNQIIACIPLEPRNFKFDKKIKKVYFITNAYIKKKFQNLGIGSDLLRLFKKKIDYPLFAFRPIKNDQASKWYKKNGFTSLYDIFSYTFNKNFILKQRNFNLEHLKKFKIERINKKNKRILNKLIKYRKSNILSSINLYQENYYKKYFKNKLIIYVNLKKKFYFVVLTKTQIGDNLMRYEILDNNLMNFKQLHKFLYFFLKSKFYKKKLPLKIKQNKISFISYVKKKYLKKDTYRSNLLSNISFKKKYKFIFNTIEYV